MPKIALTKGYFATVDACDFASVSKQRWNANISIDDPGYVRAMRGQTVAECGRHGSGVAKPIMYMHVFVAKRMGIWKPGLEVDYINGNALDNRRNNLRCATRQQNARNLKASKKGTSKYKGVSWHSQAKKWIVCIMVNYKFIHLGLFHSEKAAAHRYNEVARLLFGDFARLNEI